MRVDELVKRLSEPPFRPEDEVVVGTRTGGYRQVVGVGVRNSLGSPVLQIYWTSGDDLPCEHSSKCMHYEKA